MSGTVRRSAFAELAWRVAFDTYEREIERYGGKFLLVDTGGLGLFDEIELKKEVNELCVRAGEDPRYDLDFDEPAGESS